jgi:DNA repair exonuclease SbcCD nuclease subunit
MPYPSASRYLSQAPRRYGSLEEKNRLLQRAFCKRLEELRQCSRFDRILPSVLAAHIHVQSAFLPRLFRISEQESIVFRDADLPLDWSYVALGHIHQPQCIAGLPHVRYSGSIERLDLGEWKDQKSVVLVDLGPEGLRQLPVTIALPARPIYEVVINQPRLEIPLLRTKYRDAAQALVRLHVCYEPGSDILNDLLVEIEDIFPNWYERSWSQAGEQPSSYAKAPGHSDCFRETVLTYLDEQLLDHKDRGALVELAQALLEDTEKD